MGRFILESVRGFELFLNFLDGLMGVKMVGVGVREEVGVEVEVGLKLLDRKGLEAFQLLLTGMGI